ncbi:hypothetical protein GGI12_001054 [Dipsacomyces acuminosporus]|nr:hypothetical protein GGI12_001054 [Dipsacomyces acuminosporus]
MEEEMTPLQTLVHRHTSTPPSPEEELEYSSDAMALYDDRYIKVTREGLEIFNYYFPTGTSRFIRWESIEYVRTAKEAGVKWYALKQWGMSLGNIWWAFKFRIVKATAGGIGVRTYDEILQSNIVVKVHGGIIRPGSFVQYPEEAMMVIRKMVRKHSLRLHNE